LACFPFAKAKNPWLHFSMPQIFDVCIVGGGITGLAAAYYLQKKSPLSYVLLESAPRFGGKIQTDVLENSSGEQFLLEKGPDSFLSQKPWALALVKELGLESELIATAPSSRGFCIWRNNRANPMPEGVLTMVPTQMWPFLRSPLISPLGKLRMGLAAGQPVQLQTVHQFAVGAN